MRADEVAVDSRGRVSLAFRQHKHERYLAEEDEDGVITLTPLARVPALRLVPPPEIPAGAW